MLLLILLAQLCLTIVCVALGAGIMVTALVRHSGASDAYNVMLDAIQSRHPRRLDPLRMGSIRRPFTRQDRELGLLVLQGALGSVVLPKDYLKLAEDKCGPLSPELSAELAELAINHFKPACDRFKSMFLGMVILVVGGTMPLVSMIAR